MFNFLLTHSPLLYFTQSLWRDEAFSVLVAQHSIRWIIQSVSFEPPVYYVLLHFWIKLFGHSEIAVRSMSFIGFALACVVVIYWAEKLFKDPILRWFVPITFFFNPMLIYYAFEVRTYGWYIFFATLSTYTYYRRSWIMYIAATVLGFYTHTYILFVPMAHGVHWMVTTLFPWKGWSKTLGHLRRDPFVRATIVNLLFFLPWILRVIRDAGKLKSSWYYPVDFHLIKSVLGNMFIGYEGTPWYVWEFTSAISVLLIILFMTALRNKTQRRETLLFLSVVFVPLAIVISVSFFKPLFVNRYVIPVTIAEVFLVALGINAISSPRSRQAVMIVVLFFIGLVNTWYPPQHPKIDIRKTLMEVNAIRGSKDVILAESPLILFETRYYSSDPDRVYLYNPSRSAFPWYVGDAVFDASKVASDLPTYPMRAFLIHQDGTYDIAYHASPIATRPAKTRHYP